MKYLVFAFLFVGCISSPKTKSLRIGTTGDYAPFSFYEDDQLRGIDIELGRKIAKDLNLNIEFVKTSWSSLSEDLVSGKFDVAMSGITITEPRKDIGEFSESYYSFGKLPIARCENKHKFNSLENINKKGVRVVVNPGGTNYAFTMKNINKRNVRVFPDNAKIFKEIIANRADVMITDSVEVYYQSKVNKNKLCPTMNKTLTNSKMAFLLPKGGTYNQQIKQLLKTYKASGGLESVFNKWLK